MARARYKGENLYRTRITTDIPAISSAGNPLDVFQFDVVQAPTESKGWVFVDFTDTDSRDLIYYHAKSGNTLFYYRKDRDLLNNGSIAVTHPANDFVQINDVSQWIDYTFANLEDFGKIEDMGTNNAIIYWGSIWYNWSFQTISDTWLNALADGTWYAVFDYTDGSLKFIPSLTGFVGIRLAIVNVFGWEIISITDNRGIEWHTEMDSAFFAYNAGKVIIANGSIGTAQIADNSVTDAKLTNSGASAWTYGDVNNYPVVTVNAKGRVINMSTLPLPTLLYAYVHTQWVAAATWNINHNLNTTDLVFAVFDATDAAIVPDTFVIVDANNVTITFTGAIDGKAVLTVVGGSLAGAAWGTITGTLSSQVDLQNALDLKQDDLPLTTAWDMLIRDAGNNDARLALWSANRILKSNGTIPAYDTFIKVWTTVAMAWTSLVHADADATTTSIVQWTASATPNGFIEVVVWAWSITFNSTVAETVSFTYVLIKS